MIPVRQLAVQARQHGLNLADLALHFRMYNYFVKSGAAEDSLTEDRLLQLNNFLENNEYKDTNLKLS